MNRAERNTVRTATKTIDELTAEVVELRAIVRDLCHVAGELASVAENAGELDAAYIREELAKVRTYAYGRDRV